MQRAKVGGGREVGSEEIGALEGGWVREGFGVGIGGVGGGR